MRLRCNQWGGNERRLNILCCRTRWSCVRTDAADTLLAHCGPRKPDSTVPAGVAWQENVEQVARASRVASLVCMLPTVFLKAFSVESKLDKGLRLRE